MDLAKEQPAVDARLAAAYQTWNKDNIAPIFANPNEGVPKKERKAAKLQN